MLTEGLITGILFKTPSTKGIQRRNAFGKLRKFRKEKTSCACDKAMYLHFSGYYVWGSTELVFWGLSSVFFFFTDFLEVSQASEQ